MRVRTGRRLRAEIAVASNPTAIASTDRPMSSTPRLRSRRSASTTTVRMRVSSAARSARSSRDSASCAVVSSPRDSGPAEPDQARAAEDSSASTPAETCSTRDCTESRKARSEAGAVVRIEASVVSIEPSRDRSSGGKVRGASRASAARVWGSVSAAICAASCAWFRWNESSAAASWARSKYPWLTRRISCWFRCSSLTLKRMRRPKVTSTTAWPRKMRVASDTLGSRPGVEVGVSRPSPCAARRRRAGGPGRRC